MELNFFQIHNATKRQCRKVIHTFTNRGGSWKTSAFEVNDPSLWKNQDDTVDLSLLSAAGVNFQHVPCFAHSLQLVVHDDLKKT